MKISVGVITYNQQDTIRQTLDSILCQEGDFVLEVVIGEDCSTDKTWAICQEYAVRYPKQIVLLPNTQNLGIMANFARVMKACTGDFIADIAGDDYYSSKEALAKQSTYMLYHPKVGVMAANGYRYYVGKNKRIEGLNDPIEAGCDTAREFFFSQDYKGGVYLAPIGMMYRSELIKTIDFEEIIKRELPVEDYPIQAILSQKTQFACLPDLLVTYRIYNESATFISFDHPKYLQYHKGLMNTRRYLNELFPSDVCVSEEWMQDYEFYKEFQLYLHRKQYSCAKQLLKQYKCINNQPHYSQALRFTRTWLHFLAFHYYKEYIYRKDLRRRT